MLELMMMIVYYCNGKTYYCNGTGGQKEVWV